MIKGVAIIETITSKSKLLIIEYKSNLIKNAVKIEVIITIESTTINIDTLLERDKLFINLFI